MKCEKCGAELEQGVLFCKECGNKLNNEKRFCRECGSALSPGMKFCSNCGADVNVVDNNIPIEPNLQSANIPSKKYRTSESIIKDGRLGNKKKTNKTILAIIGLGCVLFLVILLITLGSSSKNSNLDKSVANTCFDEILPVVDANATIESGTEYAYMSDAWNVYIATAVSDKIIKIEHWDKSSQNSKKMKLDKDLGSFQIVEEENGFMWIDEQQTAFTFNLCDKDNSDIKNGEMVIFTINTSSSDNCKGTNYDDDIACYTYTNDDWHMYRAIALSDSLVKIECWYRTSSGFFDNYLYAWDLGVIDITDTQTDFAWGDDTHTAFTITMIDNENGSEWKEEKLVSFILENEKYQYASVCDYLGKTTNSVEDNEKNQKNGFDSLTNEVYEMSSYSLEIPSYWSNENSISDGFQRYAETYGKVAMLQVTSSAETDSNYEVTFDGLMSDNDNMIQMIEATAFKEVTDYEVINTGVVKGILYTGIFEADGLTGTGFWFAFPSMEDRSWCALVCGETDNTEYSYSDDFMKIISSIKKLDMDNTENDGKSYEETTETKEEDIEPSKTTETETSTKTTVILPESNTKLGKDLDTKGSSTVYYINVDGTSNIPKLEEWGSATVTDSVAEYLDYLESQGCTVSITSSDKNSPYAGYTMYETYFEVKNATVTWTMYLCIQDENFVEYELDINLP